MGEIVEPANLVWKLKREKLMGIQWKLQGKATNSPWSNQPKESMKEFTKIPNWLSSNWIHKRWTRNPTWKPINRVKHYLNTQYSWSQQHPTNTCWWNPSSSWKCCLSRLPLLRRTPDQFWHPKRFLTNSSPSTPRRSHWKRYSKKVLPLHHHRTTHQNQRLLLIMGADITLMSTELLKKVQERTKRTNETLKLRKCELNLQAYSHTGLRLNYVAPIHLTVGPMDFVHPVYVSALNTYPLLIGKYLLNRFKPLIDFKHLKIWTQVREPLPCQSLNSNESQCQVTDIAPKSMIDDAVAKPGSGPSTNSKDPLLCSLQEPEPNTGPLQIMTAIDFQGTSVSGTALALWAENSAISLKLFRTLKQRHQGLPHVSTQSATESPTQMTIGTQSPSNDHTDALTKAGALHEESWPFHALPPHPLVAAVTHRQHATGAHTPAPSHIAISPQFAADDLLTLQNTDSSLRTMAAHMSDPLEHPISTTDINTSSELHTLHSIKHMLHLRDGVLTYVPEPLTAPNSLYLTAKGGWCWHTHTMHHAQDTTLSRPPMKHSSKWHTGLACSKM